MLELFSYKDKDIKLLGKMINESLKLNIEYELISYLFYYYMNKMAHHCLQYPMDFTSDRLKKMFILDTFNQKDIQKILRKSENILQIQYKLLGYEILHNIVLKTTFCKQEKKINNSKTINYLFFDIDTTILLHQKLPYLSPYNRFHEPEQRKFINKFKYV